MSCVSGARDQSRLQPNPTHQMEPGMLPAPPVPNSNKLLLTTERNLIAPIHYHSPPSSPGDGPEPEWWASRDRLQKPDRLRCSDPRTPASCLCDQVGRQ